MTLTLHRKALPSDCSSCRLDLYGIVPDQLLSLDLASISRLNIQVDARDAHLSDHFDIIDGSRDALLLTGDLSQADRVGGGMRLGMLTVASDVGLYLAENMRQGDLIVQGSAGDYACAQMRGGRVRIAGDVGDYCAASPAGLRRGMRGGCCFVQGSAGRFLGARMRRGVIHVRGRAREGCASSMIAGSILIGGAVAAPLAVGMRRGTVVVLGPDEPPLPIGFTPFEPVKLSYLPLLLGEAEVDSSDEYQQRLTNDTWLRALGDRASEGMGEVLWLRPSKRDSVLEC